MAKGISPLRLFMRGGPGSRKAETPDETSAGPDVATRRPLGPLTEIEKNPSSAMEQQQHQGPRGPPSRAAKSKNSAGEDEFPHLENSEDHANFTTVTPDKLGLASAKPLQSLSGNSKGGSSGGSVPITPKSVRSTDSGGSQSQNSTPTKAVSRTLKYGGHQPSGGSQTAGAPPLSGARSTAARPAGLLHAGKGGLQNRTFEEPRFQLEEDPTFWRDHNVQVIIRTRPISAAELCTQGTNRCLRQENPHTLSWLGQPESRYTFDHVAGETITQANLFEVAGLPMVENCMSGYNSCMFAYGQTGSGKTHTMLGDIEDLDYDPSENRGITPRVFEYLFGKVRTEEEVRRQENLRFFCKCSFLEIYNEQITDLLEPMSTNLQLREDARKGVYVENLSEVEVQNVQDVIQLLLQGAANRKVAATNMNRESSRSHSVFTCVVESKWEANSVTNSRYGRLHLVDLAGSERQKSSGAEGGRLKEAANINKSLSTLGLVIMILVDVANGKQRHVPYRDSKLTFFLQDSLGGNSKTTMIANVSPSSCCAMETLSTLKFAQRAKYIRNNAVVNEDASGDVVALRQQIEELKGELERLRRGSIPRHTEQSGPSLEELKAAVAQLDAELAEKEMKLAAQERRLEEADTQVCQLRDESQSLAEKHEILREAYAISCEKTADLQQQVVDLESDLRESATKVKLLEEMLVSAGEQCSKMEARMVQLGRNAQSFHDAVIAEGERLTTGVKSGLDALPPEVWQVEAAAGPIDTVEERLRVGLQRMLHLEEEHAARMLALDNLQSEASKAVFTAGLQEKEIQTLREERDECLLALEGERTNWAHEKEALVAGREALMAEKEAAWRETLEQEKSTKGFLVELQTLASSLQEAESEVSKMRDIVQSLTESKEVLEQESNSNRENWAIEKESLEAEREAVMAEKDNAQRETLEKGKAVEGLLLELETLKSSLQEAESEVSKMRDIAHSLSESKEVLEQESNSNRENWAIEKKSLEAEREAVMAEKGNAQRETLEKGKAVQSLLIELETLKSNHQEAESKVSDMESRIEALTVAKAVLEQERDGSSENWATEKETLTAEREAAIAEKDNAQRETLEKEEAMQALLVDLETLKSNQHETEFKVSEMECRVRELTVAKELLEKEGDGSRENWAKEKELLLAKCESVLAEKEEVQRSSLEQEKALQDLLVEFQKLGSSLQEAESKITEMASNIQILTVAKEVLEQERDGLQSSAREIDNKCVEKDGAFVAIQGELTALQARLSEAEQREQITSERTEDLRATVIRLEQEKEMEEKAVQCLRVELQTLGCSLQEAESKVFEMQDSVQALTISKEALEQERDALLRSAHEADKQCVETLESSRQEVKSKVSNMTNTVEALTIVAEALEQERDGLLRSARETENECIEREKAFVAMEGDFAALQARLREAEQREHATSETMEELQAAVTQLNHEKEAEEKAVQDLRMELQTLGRSLQEAESRASEMQDSIQALTVAKEALEREGDRLLSSANDHEADKQCIETLRSSLQEAESKVSELTVAKEVLERERDGLLSSVRDHEAHKQCIGTLTSSLQEAESTISEMTNNIQALAMAKEVLERERDGLLSSVHDHEADKQCIGTLNSSLQEAESTISELTNNVQALAVAKEILERERDGLHSSARQDDERIEKEEAFVAIQSHLAELQARLREAEQREQATSENVADHRATTIRFEHEKETAEKEVQGLQVELQTLRTSLHEAESKVLEMQNSVQTLTAAKEVLEQERDAQLDEKFIEKGLEVAAIQGDLAALQARLREAEQREQSTAEETDSLRAAVVRLEHEKEVEEKALQCLRMELQTLESSLQKAESKVSEMQSSVEALTVAKEVLEKERDGPLSSAREADKHCIETLESSLREAEFRVAEMGNKIEALTVAKEGLEHERDSLLSSAGEFDRKYIETLESRLQEAEMKVPEMANNIQALTVAKEVLEQERVGLINSAREAEENCIEKEGALIAIKGELAVLLSRLQDAEQREQSTSERMGDLNALAVRLEHDKVIVEHELIDLKEQNAKLQLGAIELHSEIGNRETALFEGFERSQHVVERADSRMAALDGDLAELKEAEGTLEHDVEAFELAAFRYTAAVEDSEAELQKRLRNAEAEISDMQAALQRASAEASSERDRREVDERKWAEAHGRENKLRDLVAGLESSKARLEQEIGQMKESEDEHFEMQRRLESAESQVSEMRAAMDLSAAQLVPEELDSVVDERKWEEEDEMKAREDLRGEIASSELKLADIQKTLQAASESLEALGSRRTELDQEVQDLHMEIATYQSEAAEHREHIEALRKLSGALKAECEDTKQKINALNESRQQCLFSELSWKSEQNWLTGTLEEVHAHSSEPDRAHGGIPVDGDKSLEQVGQEHFREELDNQALREKIREKEMTILSARKEMQIAMGNLREAELEMDKVHREKEKLKKRHLEDYSLIASLSLKLQNAEDELSKRAGRIEGCESELEKVANILCDWDTKMNDAESDWKMEKLRLSQELSEARLDATEKSSEAAVLFQKFEDGQSTLKEAEDLVESLVRAHEEAKHSLRDRVRGTIPRSGAGQETPRSDKLVSVVRELERELRSDKQAMWMLCKEESMGTAETMDILAFAEEEMAILKNAHMKEMEHSVGEMRTMADDVLAGLKSLADLRLDLETLIALCGAAERRVAVEASCDGQEVMPENIIQAGDINLELCHSGASEPTSGSDGSHSEASKQERHLEKSYYDRSRDFSILERATCAEGPVLSQIQAELNSVTVNVECVRVQTATVLADELQASNEDLNGCAMAIAVLRDEVSEIQESMGGSSLQKLVHENQEMTQTISDYVAIVKQFEDDKIWICTHLQALVNKLEIALKQNFDESAEESTGNGGIEAVVRRRFVALASWVDSALSELTGMKSQIQTLQPRVTSLEMEVGQHRFEVENLMKKEKALHGRFLQLQQTLASDHEVLVSTLASCTELVADVPTNLVQCEEMALLREIGATYRACGRSFEDLKEDVLGFQTAATHERQIYILEREVADHGKHQLIAEKHDLLSRIAVLEDELEERRLSMEKHQAQVDDRGPQAWQDAEPGKCLAKDNGENDQIIFGRVEELENTISALENKLACVIREAEEERMARAEVEREVGYAKDRMSILQANMSLKAPTGREHKDAEASQLELDKVVIEMKNQQLQARQTVERLQQECAEKEVHLRGCRAHIDELKFGAEKQASENQQKLKTLELMVEKLKADGRKGSSGTAGGKVAEKLTPTKVKASGSPFKCIGSSLAQQRSAEMDEDLLAAERRIRELEAIAAARQKEIFMLNTKLAEAESMTHDVVRDLLGVKMDIASYATILNQQQVQRTSERARRRTEEAQEKEEEVITLRKNLNEFVQERESWLDEINRRQAEAVAARVCAEKLRLRDQTFVAENERLQAERSAMQQKLAHLEDEVRKLSGQQNLQQRIHHHAKIKEENKAIRLQNEDLSAKLRRMEILFTRVNDELTWYRTSTHGNGKPLNFEEEARLKKALEETEENRLQLAQTLTGLYSSILQAAGIQIASSHIDLSAAMTALQQMQDREENLERELSACQLKVRIDEEHKRLSSLRNLSSTPVKRSTDFTAARDLCPR